MKNKLKKTIVFYTFSILLLLLSNQCFGQCPWQVSKWDRFRHTISNGFSNAAGTIGNGISNAAGAIKNIKIKIKLPTGGGGSDEDYDDDYGGDDGGGGDDGDDWGDFDYGDSGGGDSFGGSCTSSALNNFNGVSTWENYAQNMGITNLDYTGPITSFQRDYFNKNFWLLCNKNLLKIAIESTNVVEKCSTPPNEKDVDAFMDYLHDPDKLASPQTQQQLNCYYSATIGQTFADCVFPVGTTNASAATLYNASALLEYVKANPKDKFWVDINGCDLISKIEDCKKLGGKNCTDDILKIMEDAIALSDPEFWKAVINAGDILKKCIDTKEWKYLATFIPPKEVQDHVTASGGQVQSMDGTFGPIINLDYFGFEICGLPKKADGTIMTKEEFIEYIRKNISVFTETIFDPKLADSFDDTQLFFSNSPLSSLVHIDIPGDNGSVVISNYDSNGWIFTTVTIGSDGYHPVSGNRQFSLYIDADGKLQFFIKGADRISNALAGDSPLGVLFAMSQADQLWTKTIKNITDYIKSNGGCVIEKEFIKARPNWKDVKSCWKKSKDLEKCIFCY